MKALFMLLRSGYKFIFSFYVSIILPLNSYLLFDARVRIDRSMQCAYFLHALTNGLYIQI